MIHKDALVIVDAYGFAFRAYYSHPQMHGPDGSPTNALFGFTGMLLRLIKDFSPAHCVIVFDYGGKNFRHHMYDQYKANRPPAPPELKAQLPLIRYAAKALNFATLEIEGFEADDIIASIAKKHRDNRKHVVIFSSDKDLMQIVDEQVLMHDPLKHQYIDSAAVYAKFGVYPKQIPDFLSIVGDAADNVPGIKGLGPKTAAELLKEYSNLDGILANIDLIKSAKVRNNILNHIQEAKLSLDLVTLKDDIDFGSDNFEWTPPKGSEIFGFLKQYGFKSLVAKVETAFNLKQEHSYTKNNSDAPTIEKININTQNEYEIELPIHNIFGIVLSTNTLFASNNSKCYIIQDQDLIKQFLLDTRFQKVIYDAKKIMHLYLCNNLQDPMLAYYALFTGIKQLSLQDMLREKLGRIGCNDPGLLAHDTLQLHHLLIAQLTQLNKLHLYQDIEMPLCYILSEMEKAGIKVDAELLRVIEGELEESLKILEEEIHIICGMKFNIASSKQLGEVLFEKMQLQFGKKKTKAEQYSTDIETLEYLSGQGVYVADLLIRWRHLSKLKSTYTKSLIIQINKETNRVHTTFNQVATSTSRLSSTHPNLQNIPTKLTDGGKIRSSFVAEHGYVFLSADYSQIELRILAKIAGVKMMQDAFEQGIDVHTLTASEVYDIPYQQVTESNRSDAKAVNFGIIYGMSAFGLANNLKIRQQQAEHILDRYFNKYHEIKSYMEHTKSSAYKHGFVENILGRRCYIPYINDKNYHKRTFAERAAINAPIQSAAADIIKMATIKVNQAISNSGCKLVLQIHDEILLEVPRDKAQDIGIIVMHAMQEIDLLKLVANVKIGSNWRDMHLMQVT